MYWQLAHWPGYLGPAAGLLRPLHDDGELERLADRTLVGARYEARQLARRILRDVGELPQRAGGRAMRAHLQTLARRCERGVLIECSRNTPSLVSVSSSPRAAGPIQRAGRLPRKRARSRARHLRHRHVLSVCRERDLNRDAIPLRAWRSARRRAEHRR
jgi:hypothetical protein